MSTSQHKSFSFFLMTGNLGNCYTNADGLRAHVIETRVAFDGARTEKREVTLVHRATRGNWEAAEAVEARLIARCEEGPDAGHTVLSTEHWDVVNWSGWYHQ